MGSCEKTVWILLLLIFEIGIVASKAIHTSGPHEKLDFGSSGEITQLKNKNLVSVKIPSNTDYLGSASDITKSVSCGAGGCNTTKTNNTVETEVLIHVQTKVNLDQDQKKRVEDTSDVPIVVGHKSSGPDNEPFDRDGYRSDISNREYGSYTPFRPTYTNPPNSPFYNQRNSNSVYDNNYYGSSTYRPPINRNYYESSSISNTPNGGLYGPTTDRSLSGYSPSPLNIPDRPSHYNNNRVELRIPYFEHAYNTHYFREEPPPYNVLLDKSNSYNPVEFRRFSWTPSTWNGRNYKFGFNNNKRNYENPNFENRLLPGHNQLVHHANHDVGCSCRNFNTAIPQDSNIYAESSLNSRIAVPDKKITLDDKIAPLI